jgi:hypothetical protein
MKSGSWWDNAAPLGRAAFVVFFIVYFGGGLVAGIVALMHKAHSADLAVPLPKPRPERCLITGENPDPGQTLHVDKRCKSGLRWIYER